MDSSSYFIPYVLSSYEGSAIPTVEVSDVQPLLIVWRRDHDKRCKILPVPQGLFPLAMMHLLNQSEIKTELPPSRSDYYFKFRDAMSIKITFDQISHTLHLINCYTHIEMSFNGPLKHCAQIRKLVMKAIGKVTNDLHIEHDYINAFNCLQDQEKKCYCIVVNEKQFKINCTECPESYPNPITEDKYKYWFECFTGEIDAPLNTKSQNRGLSEECEMSLPLKRQRNLSSLSIKIEVATKVLSKNSAMLRRCIDLKYFADKMNERKIIHEDKRRSIVSDTMTGLSEDQRKDRLIDELKDAITFDGSLFPWLVEILNDYDTVTSQGVANKLTKDYNELI